MVTIFSKTTTCLSEEFLAQLSEDLLELTLENLRSLPGVSCEKEESTFCLKGQWHDLVTAYVSLEQCLIERDYDKLNIDKELGNVSKETERDISPDIDYTFVTVKKETDGVDSDLNEQKDVNDDTVVKVDNNESDEDTEIEEPLLLSSSESNLQHKRQIGRRSTYQITKRFKTVPESGQTLGGHKCNKCSYVGKSDKNLENHTARKHHRPFKCDRCTKRFGFKNDLDRHKIDVHEKTKNYFCPICNKFLKTKTYIDDHMLLHADNYVYQCKTCEKSFSTKQVFAKHMKQKHPNILFDIEDLDEVLPADNNKTSPGGESPSDQSNDKSSLNNTLYKESSSIDILMLLNREEKVMHENNLYKITLKEGKNKGRPRLKSYVEQPDDRTEFPCHLCSYIGKKESHLENHIIRSHSQKFICDICQKQFGYNWDLKRHKEQVHAEASYFCHICSKAYKVKKSFDEHLRSHEAGYVKSVYPCTECDKAFSAKQVLDNHMKIKHLGVKQKEKQKYLCQTCGAEFYHKYSYQSHMNKHAGLMPYSCDICGKAFASEHSVKEHQITHKDTREFHCHACPKSFKTSSALNAHVAIHEGKKNFKCSVCGKGFIQKQSLVRHERIHSGYKPFACALCSRVFTDSATIRKHMILVHKSDPHDWQGDVISDLKKPGEFWLGDLTAEPKLEPDFRRKADRERMQQLTSLQGEQSSQEEEMDKDLESDNNSMYKSNKHTEYRAKKGKSKANNEQVYSSIQLGMSGNQATECGGLRTQGNLNNIQHQVTNILDSSASTDLSPIQTGSGEPKKGQFWRGDAYMEAGMGAQRAEEVWHPGVGRQGEAVHEEEMVELKRPSEYWPAGVVLDATRPSEYFRGGNIPDPRKQVEFWQGHSAAEQKVNSDSMHTELTTLQNMNFSA